MGSRRRSDSGDVRLLTVGIETVHDQLDKLHWNLENFLKESSRSEPSGDSVIFSAIDYAKAAAALQDWTKARYDRAVRKKLVEPVLGTDANARILDVVPWQGPLRAIANTAKHGRHDPNEWPGGAASVILEIQGPAKADWDYVDRMDLAETLSLLARVFPNEEAWWRFVLVERGAVTQGTKALTANYSGWDQLLAELPF